MEKCPSTPGESASNFKVGAKRVVRNAAYYQVVKSDKTGRKYWKKYKPPHARGRVYFPDDNGGKPFAVYVNPGKSARGLRSVAVYKVPGKYPDCGYSSPKSSYNALIKRYTNVKRIFIGNDNKYGDCSGASSCGGNSILLELNSPKGRYVYIGWVVFEFSTPIKQGQREVITEYYGTMGGSRVVYPVAVSDNYVYLLIEEKYLNKRYRSNGPIENAYNDLYCHQRCKYPIDVGACKKRAKHARKLLNFNVVHQRYL